MKKALKVLSVTMILAMGSMVAFSTSHAQSAIGISAVAKKGHWVTIDTHYEDGKWHILQECKVGGSDCVRGKFKTIKQAGALQL
ncbi:MAG: hypothetical protein AB8G15_14080 [Saprospiraceae bacterium]